VAIYFILLLLVLIPMLMFVPWTQTVYGSGRAIAFNPVQRPQFLVSPIEGRVKKWYVFEGDKVVAGQLIAELVDNDPRRLERLEEQALLGMQRVQLAEDRVMDLRNRITFVKDERELLLAEAQARIEQNEAQVLVAMQDLERAKADLVREGLNYDRKVRLNKSSAGKVASDEEVEEAKRRLDLAAAQVPLVEARIKLAEKTLAGSQAFKNAQDKRTNANISFEEALLRTSQGELASVQQQYNTVKTELERQRNQSIQAPSDGTIFRLLANAEAGGLLVRPGERLAVLAPEVRSWIPLPPSDHDVHSAVVGGPALAAYQILTPGDQPGTVAELFIDGNDLPLVRKGDRVLLQFEGFPAVQFAGIPDVAMGVFEGKIYLVDPTADEKAKFRILVEPATTKPEGEMIEGRRVMPWPDDHYIRQGLRVQGWALIAQVKLGWELWRLLNGFPPAREIVTKDGGSKLLGPVSGVGKK
jgi:multidrug efflux pump subunit AcrA (membrane-fusion protein)